MYAAFALAVAVTSAAAATVLPAATTTALATLATTSTVAAAAPARGDTLDADLAQVRAQLEAPRCEERARAHATLWARLEARRAVSSAASAELTARRDELRELARRTAFAARYESPALTELIGGDEASWNPRTGTLEVEYSRSSPREEAPATGAAGGSEFQPFGFEERHGVLVSRIPFDGPCQLELHGRAPRSFVRDPPPSLWLLAPDEREFEMWFTWPSTHERSVGKWTQGKARLWRHGQPTLLARDRTPGGKYDLGFDESYVLKLRVTRSALLGSLNGFGMLKASKRRRGYGRLGFAHCPDVERVRLSGRVERETIDALRTRRWELDLARELERPAPPDTELLPSWLVETSPGAP